MALNGPLKVLRVAVPASPALRNSYARVPPEDASSSQITVLLRPIAEGDAARERFLWTIRVLADDGELLDLMQLPLVADKLERLLETELQAKALVSAYVASSISDVSIPDQCLSQLNLYQPRSRSFEQRRPNWGRQRGVSLPTRGRSAEPRRGPRCFARWSTTSTLF